MAESVMFFADDPNGDRRIVSSSSYRQTHRPYITNGVVKEGDLAVSLRDGVTGGLTVDSGAAYIVGSMYINDDLINVTDSERNKNRCIKLQASNSYEAGIRKNLISIADGGVAPPSLTADYIILATYHIDGSGKITNLVNNPHDAIARLKVDPNDKNYRAIGNDAASSESLARSVGSDSDFGVYLSVNPNLLNLLIANSTFKNGITSNSNFINNVAAEIVAAYPV